MKKLYEFIEKVKDNPKFQELEELTQMTVLKDSVEESLRYYVKIFFSKQFSEYDYEDLIDFINDYIQNKPAEIIKTEEGYIDLGKTKSVRILNDLAKNSGNFGDGWIMLTDGSKYMRKLPLAYRGNSRNYNPDSKYCSIIAAGLAKQLEIDTAEYYLGEKHNQHISILTPNFLKDGEKLHCNETNGQYISGVLKEFEVTLTREEYGTEQIEQLKFDYIKQRFFAKIIDLKDESADNIQYVTGTDENGNKYVKMSPMFDYDYSFHVTEKNTDLLQLECDNGKTDILSFIEQYKEYPGFREFVSKCASKYNMYEVFRNTGLQDFNIANGKKRKMQEEFNEFVNNQMKKVKEAYKEVYGVGIKTGETEKENE